MVRRYPDPYHGYPVGSAPCPGTPTTRVPPYPTTRVPPPCTTHAGAPSRRVRQPECQKTRETRPRGARKNHCQGIIGRAIHAWLTVWCHRPVYPLAWPTVLPKTTVLVVLAEKPLFGRENHCFGGFGRENHCFGRKTTVFGGFGGKSTVLVEIPLFWWFWLKYHCFGRNTTVFGVFAEIPLFWSKTTVFWWFWLRVLGGVAKSPRWWFLLSPRCCFDEKVPF